MSAFTFQALGGASEVGASCYHYTFGETRILIDAGVRPNAIGPASLPNLELLKEAPTAILITHAHSDHIGALPLVHQRFPRTPIFATEPTARIMLDMLKDAVNVQRAQGAPLYNLEDVAKALNSVQLIRPHEAFVVGGVRVTPVPAGHLLGAVSFELRSSVGSVLHTGDVNNTGGYLTDAAYQPEDAVPVDVVVCESTYGDTVSHSSRKGETKRFVDAVRGALEGGGRVLIPAFALGRSTEVALTLADHMASGLLPTVPVVLDGLVRTVHDTIATDLFGFLPVALRNRKKNSGLNPLHPPMLRSVSDHRERHALIHSDEPMIIIASSGMLSAGVSPQYAKQVVQGENNLLAFVGYQDEGAPGKRLLELTEQGGEVTLPTGLEGAFEQIPVHCSIGAFSFSGHADASGLISLVKRYSPKRILLVHGDGNARSALGEFLRKTAHIDWPMNHATADLAAPTYQEQRATSRPAVQAEKPAGRTRFTRFQTHARTTVQDNKLILEFPGDVDVGHLFGGVDGLRVEVVRGVRLNVKLREVRPHAPEEAEAEVEDAEVVG